MGLESRGRAATDTTAWKVGHPQRMYTMRLGSDTSSCEPLDDFGAAIRRPFSLHFGVSRTLQNYVLVMNLIVHQA
jgi:hypothetical protein